MNFSDLFRTKLVLAPIAGYTDYPFRKLCSSFGAGMVYTELISAEGIVYNSDKTKKLMHIYEDEHPASIQLFGKNAESMRQAVLYANELKPALIDINMGCCAQKVCSSGSGAALLKNPLLAGSIAEAAVSASSVPVSAKIRLGWDHTTINYNEIITVLYNSGISLVTVHGRTRSQFYEGLADWTAIAEIADTSPIPVIGNGDIHSYEEAMMRLETTKCAAVMIGRGALGKPWIFSEHGMESSQAMTVMKKHLQAMVDYYGDYGILLFRKHAVKYIHDVAGAAKSRCELLQTTDLSRINAIIESAFQSSRSAAQQ